MNKKIIIFLAVLILIIIVITFVGFFSGKKQKKEIKGVGSVEVKEKREPLPLPIIEEKERAKKTEETTSTKEGKETTEKPSKLLFNQALYNISIDYPLIYVYDPDKEVIKYLDLENEAFREIIKVSGFKNAWLSDDKTKIIIETEAGLSLVDLKTDELFALPPFTRGFFFTPQPWLFISNDKDIFYLAEFKNGITNRIRYLGILNPEFAPLKDEVLIYEKNSPIFSLELKSPNSLKIFLDDHNYYDVLVSKDKSLIYLVYQSEGKWQSKIIDLSKKTRYLFSWGVNKEKCSFNELLVCALPMNPEPGSWAELGPSFDVKIVIFNPKNNSIKEVKIEDKLDLIKPTLTPLGIIAWDRLSQKFYLLKAD
jgi:hypothetical protein